MSTIVEYRVIGATQTAMFGPTKRRDLAERMIASRQERYPFLGPWRIQERKITEWADLTGTLFQ